MSMNLPSITVPNFVLPFEVPALLHPVADHFAIAIPVIVLLLELINLFVKSRSISLSSFFLLFVAVVAGVGAYFTGITDGSAVFDSLSTQGQTELKEHKLLGIYLVLVMGVVFILKMFSMMIQKGMMKALYLIVFMVLVAGLVKQGHEGGELVYKYGANVEKVGDLEEKATDLEDKVVDFKDEISNKEEIIKEQKERIEEMNDALEVVKKEAKEAKAEATSLQTKVAQAQAQVQTLKVKAVVPAKLITPVTVATPVKAVLPVKTETNSSKESNTTK